jgi:hypothetical protein
MPIVDLFSKREKQKRGEVPDVFQYNNLPSPFRVQVVHILHDAFGEPRPFDSTVMDAFKTIHDILCREYGLFSLSKESQTGIYNTALYTFFLNCENSEKALDVIELSFRLIDNIGRTEDYCYIAQPKLNPDQAIQELNGRFLEHGIGFQYESGNIVRVDSKFIHAEVVKPTLNVLSDKRYAGANEEFLNAHDHYRHGRYKECLNECLKSFESTMKAICKKRKWEYTDTDTAKNLIERCLQKGLIPTYLQTHFTSLRASLESGVPTIRNKLSGHGQGDQPVDLPQYFAAYMLNLTATTILFLTEAEMNLA